MVLVKKDKGTHVSKLNTICLMEADFNHNNKKIRSDVVQYADVMRSFPENSMVA